MKKEKITGEEIGGLLFNIHTHMDNGEIVYKEKDIIKLLTKLGLPEPIWGGNIDINKFKK